MQTRVESNIDRQLDIASIHRRDARFIAIFKVALDDPTNAAQRVFEASLHPARTDNVAIRAIAAEICNRAGGRVDHRTTLEIIGKHLRARRAHQVIGDAIDHNFHGFARTNRRRERFARDFVRNLLPRPPAFRRRFNDDGSRQLLGEPLEVERNFLGNVRENHVRVELCTHAFAIDIRKPRVFAVECEFARNQCFFA